MTLVCRLGREVVLSSVRRSEESGIGLVRRQWAPLRFEIDVTETERERGKRRLKSNENDDRDAASPLLERLNGQEPLQIL